MFINLLNKEDIYNENDDNLKLILKNCYAALWDNFIYSTEFDNLEDKEWVSSFSRVLLRKMEKVFSIRSIYKKQVDTLLGSDNIQLSKGYFDYIEYLFGYKSYEMLESYIKDIYDNNASVSISHNTFSIECYVNNIKDYSIPDQDVLLEILKYSKNVQKVNSVDILIHANTNDVGNHLEMIQHIISFLSHTCRTTRKWSNGNTIQEKPEFISV